MRTSLLHQRCPILRRARIVTCCPSLRQRIVSSFRSSPHHSLQRSQLSTFPSTSMRCLASFRTTSHHDNSDLLLKPSCGLLHLHRPCPHHILTSQPHY